MKNDNPLKSISTFYNKMSIFGKILVILALFLMIVIFFNSVNARNNKNITNITTEGFVEHNNFLYKSGVDIYDKFYSEIYDQLVFSNVKDVFEIGAIKSKTEPSEHSKILDIGSGTGHHVGKFTESGLDIVGLDISPSMIAKATELYPNCKFQQGDALNNSSFSFNTFTHILCMYFTIYYFKDKNIFLQNCYDWLMPGGFLIIHIVDRDNFDPILPPGNPLLLVSPQKYAKKRITSTKLKFNNFEYSANFNFKPQEDLAIFNEKFKFKDGKVRKQEHKLYMEDENAIINIAQNIGFIVESQIDLIKCAYANQYLYIFTKPE
jgi:SAM-dependent methyltransferase